MKEKKGMTLVEILAALALSAFMVAAMGGILKGMAQKKKVFGRQAEGERWGHILGERLRDDLMVARQFQCDGRQLTILGFCGRNDLTGEKNKKLVTVKWSI